VVGWTRPDYFSQVVVLADGPVKTLANLKGRKISFGEIGSTSQHLGPAQILMDAGLSYGRDYEPVFVKRNVAIEALKRGDIAAIGLNLTYLQLMRRANPGVPLRVLGRGRDLPDDLILASSTVPAATVSKMRETFLNKGDEIMKAVVSVKGDNEKYMGGVFLHTSPTATTTSSARCIARSGSTNSRNSSGIDDCWIRPPDHARPERAPPTESTRYSPSGTCENRLRTARRCCAASTSRSAPEKPSP
jgi:hypothetical protein